MAGQRGAFVPMGLPGSRAGTTHRAAEIKAWAVGSAQPRASCSP